MAGSAGLSTVMRKLGAIAAVVTCVVVATSAAGVARPVRAPSPSRLAVTTLAGRLLSGGRPLGFVPVTLYRAGAGGARRPVALGRSRSGGDGSFVISYRSARHRGSVLYLVAGQGAAVRLAAIVGGARAPASVVVTERTTVAAGFALAQFISGRNVSGPTPGPQNAAAMASNLVDVRTGALSRVLTGRANGNQTMTLRTFNSLANLLVPCVRSAVRCGPLLRLARPPAGGVPAGALAAVADIARNPAHNAGRLFALARSHPALYRPALSRSQRPGAWILALRFDGDAKTMDGPGNSAIDAEGNVWVINNYTFSTSGTAPVCGGRMLFKLTPAGRYAPGSPYTGGGVNGAGYGVTLDPRGNIWVGNFGFSSQACAEPPPHNSVSEFRPSGRALSPDAAAGSSGGFTAGNVSWPQGTVSDRRGNIWLANCGNNTVTRYAGGNPRAATDLSDLGIEKPFDIAFNRRGQAFVTGNGNDAVAMLNPNGTPARPPITKGGFDEPLGIAADSQGNMWVANSAAVDVPCPKGGISFRGKGSVTLISKDGAPRPKPFTGGGLTAPWGIAVDGHNNVWVSNFSHQRVSELCGTEPSRCPPGTHTGQPISPASGYGFDGLTRNTSLEIDPSGNVWITNNWKLNARPLKNPGGYQMVAYIGVAAPLRTPLIGPPRSL